MMRNDENLSDDRRIPTVLPKRRKDHEPSDIGSGSSISSSRQASLSSERKWMDRNPRDIRLSNRMGSPLGMTLEELADRGLLDGGASVPSYHTSLKQRNRRPLELKNRSSRLQQRENYMSDSDKLATIMAHMIRVLVNKGLNIEEYCKMRETESSGEVDRQVFISLLRNLGLPFTKRQLHDITQPYLIPNSSNIDYIALLNQYGVHQGKLDKGLSSTGNRTLETTIVSAISYESETTSSRKKSNSELSPLNLPNDMNISSFNIIGDVKVMLLQAMESLKRGVDDIYRMFARWDTDGTGQITATQFLRVLQRLHIEINDDDQDFLIDLLDISGMGRINFENLLTYFFSEEFPELSEMPSPDRISILRSLCKCNGEDIQDGNVNSSVKGYSSDSKSVSSNSSQQLRLFNGVSRSNQRPSSSSDIRRNSHELDSHSDASAQGRSYRDDTADRDSNNGNSGRNKTGPRQRPLTASARISSHAVLPKSSPKNSGNKSPASSSSSSKKRENGILIDDISDDYIIDDDDDDELELESGNYNGTTTSRQSYKYHNRAESFDTNTITTAEQEEIFLPALTRRTTDTTDYREASGELNGSMNQISSNDSEDQMRYLASKSLKKIRDICVSSLRSGQSFDDIYRFFDRKNTNISFDMNDFICSLNELNIQVDEQVIQTAFASLTAPGYSTILLGELYSFIMDPTFNSLQHKVIDYMIKLLQEQGKSFHDILMTIFQPQQNTINDRYQRNGSDDCFISSNDFRNILSQFNIPWREIDEIGSNKLGQISTSIDRLISRFSVSGLVDDIVAVSRFLAMIVRSKEYKSILHMKVYQDLSSKEANILRDQLSQGIISPLTEGITENVLQMAEYLHICLITERNLLWIVHDALNAPLPRNWKTQCDSDGKIFFHNTLTRQSRWDHPLDQQFRYLRDQYRTEFDPMMTAFDQAGQQSNSYDAWNQYHRSNYPEIEIPSSQPANEFISMAARIRPASAANSNYRQQFNNNTINKLNVIDDIYRHPFNIDHNNINAYESSHRPPMNLSTKTSRINQGRSNSSSNIRSDHSNILSETYPPATTITTGAFGVLNLVSKTNPNPKTSKNTKQLRKPTSRPISAVDRLMTISNNDIPSHTYNTAAARSHMATNLTAQNQDLPTNLPLLYNKTSNSDDSEQLSHRLLYNSSYGTSNHGYFYNDSRNRSHATDSLAQKYTREMQLAELFDANLINRLDSIILPKTNTNKSNDYGKTVGAGKGGIVLI